VNQKARTRAAIVAAARDLCVSGQPVGMAEVARTALVSEATAYRYFPDLASLLTEAMPALWPDPSEAEALLAGVTEPAERVAVVAEHLMRLLLRAAGAVRTMIALTVARPGAATPRPGLRFGLIEQALAPCAHRLPPAELDRLRTDLALVISSDAFFGLVDLAGVDAEAAVRSVVRTARIRTEHAFLGV
jgi:AcrR family transcriptional regulator